MNLIFKIQESKQKGRVPVDVILEKESSVYEEKVHPAPFFERCRVESADKVLEGLDKVLKKNKIGITDIKSIKTVDNFGKISYTSYRIVKSVEKALKIKLF